MTSVMHMNVGHNVLSNLGPHALDNAFHQLRSLSEDRGLNSIAVSRGLDSVMELNNSQYNSNDQSGASVVRMEGVEGEALCEALLS